MGEDFSVMQRLFMCGLFSASGIDRRRHQSLTVIAFCGKSHQKQEDPTERWVNTFWMGQLCPIVRTEEKSYSGKVALRAMEARGTAVVNRTFIFRYQTTNCGLRK